MDKHADAARLLLSARRDPTQRLVAMPTALAPQTQEQAYLAQRAVMAELGAIGGWKVGWTPPGGPFTCAPLPKSGILPSPAEIGPECDMRRIEAEIAVTLGADLPGRDIPYTEAELRAAVASAHPAIEVLQSRFVDPGAVDPLSQLADGLGHYALVVGPAMTHWTGVDIMTEVVRVRVNGAEVKQRTGNPAGDMLRLLVWLANEGARWAGGLHAGEVVTTGSWTGFDTVPPGGTGQVVFTHMGAAAGSFA